MKDSVAAHNVITANRLVDGAVVYMKIDGESVNWTTGIDDASTFEAERTEKMLELAQKDESANVIVGPYSIEIAGRHRPLTQREKIRAQGPSIRFGAAALPPKDDYSI